MHQQLRTAATAASQWWTRSPAGKAAWKFWAAAVAFGLVLAVMTSGGSGGARPGSLLAKMGMPGAAAGGPPADDGYDEEDPGNISAEQEAIEEKTHPTPDLARDGAKCAQPMHFLPFNKQRKHPVALASFPGSGNTWMRFLIEQGTRVYTGSVYKDAALNSTYPGEGLDDTQLIAVKTHYPCPNCWTYQRCPVCAGGLPVTDADAAVFLLRSPFDALLAEFHRLRTGKHAGELSLEDFRKTPKRKAYETAFDQPSWNDFINQRLVAYAKAARTYLDHPTKARYPGEIKKLEATEGSSSGGEGETGSTGGKLSPEDIERRKIEFEQSDRFVTKGGRLTKLVFYERLKKDPEAELVKVFQFFQDLYESEGIKDALITPAQAAARCALHHYKAAAATHFVWERKHTKRFNPWTQNQIKLVCKELGKWWFTDIWGECLEGKLQWERDPAALAANAASAEKAEENKRKEALADARADVGV